MNQSAHDWPYADALKRIRELEGISMETAAQRIGNTRSGWDKWERQRKAPSEEVLKAIVAAFPVSPEAIGYEPPEGWELVPSEWIRKELAAIRNDLTKLLERS